MASQVWIFPSMQPKTLTVEKSNEFVDRRSIYQSFTIASFVKFHQKTFPLLHNGISLLHTKMFILVNYINCLNGRWLVNTLLLFILAALQCTQL